MALPERVDSRRRENEEAQLRRYTSYGSRATEELLYTAENEKMIDREFISRMKDGAILINTARGGLVDENALAEALKCGKLSGAGLDVLDLPGEAYATHPLMHMENVVVTPHIAWIPRETRARLLKLVGDNILTFAAGRPQNVVNGS